MRQIFFLIAITVGLSNGQLSTLDVHFDQPGHEISPVLWGIFFEEINHAGDGGLYAELIKNRNLSPKQDFSNLDGYSAIHTGSPWIGISHTIHGLTGEADSRIYLSMDNPLNEVLHSSLRLNVEAPLPLGERIGVANTGFWGIPIRPDYTSYRASFYAKATPDFTGSLTVSIESNNGSITYVSASVPSITDSFEKYEVILTPLENLIQIPTQDTRFVISTNDTSITTNTSLFFNLISLFPPTFKNRENGMRTDIAQKLADAKPSFFRFPGGNFLEGNTIPERFIWEETIGDISERPGHHGCWNYYSSDGLGLLEYLQLAEDLEAEVILGVYAGYSLNGDSVAPEEMGPYIDSALNEIEYVIGNTSTTWGAIRAANGHPEPFPLTYVEIGNEDWISSDYETRYALFYDAIIERYPEIEIIATQVINSRPIPIIDDHYYPGFGWFPDNHRRYDDTPRNGSKIFVGEYATRDNINPDPTDHANTAAAMDDAAFMTGLERNSDIVIMACYAPLFANLKDLAWAPDAIYYDGLQSFATPAWWVQHMFSVFRGDTYIPTESDADPQKFFHVASLNTETNTLIVKMVNTNSDDTVIDTVQLHGLSNGPHGGRMTMLTGGRWDINDLDNPLRVSPTVESFDLNGNSFTFVAPAFSMTVFEFQL